MVKRPVKYDFTPNSLFRSGPDFRLNACVGTNGGPYDLRAYGQGFFDGGKAIIQAARDGSAPVDILVYPAAFSFRHGIELYLKHLIASVRKLRDTPPLPKNHSIIAAFNVAVERLALTESKLTDPVDVGIARDIVADFHQIDPTAQVFRYPEDLVGNLHLAGLSLINVEVLEDGMSVLRNILEDWMDRLEYLIDAEYEMRSHYGPPEG